MSGLAIVTGASRGIGAATAVRLAADGWTVIVNYLNSADSAEAVAERCGNSAIAVRADVSTEAGVFDLFSAADDLGTLGCLVNNAGILETQMRLEEMTEDRLQRVTAANVIGPMLCAREAVRRMSTRHGGDGGVIVNVSSMAAKYGSPGEYVDYAATKGAIDSMTVGLAREVAAEGIRVNGVRPGTIYTDIHASGGEPGRADRVAPTVPMGRSGQPQEVADAIAWLCSERSTFVTGTFVDVAGGR